MRWWIAACVALVTGVAAAQPRATDPSLRVARVLAERVQRTRAFRETYRGPSVFWTRPGALWSIQPERECHRALTETAIRWRPMRWTPTPVPAPVEILGSVSSVAFEKKRDGAPLFMSCELALRLPHLASVLRRHDVTSVEVMSAYRREPLASFHSAGLALDLSSFRTSHGVLSVEEHFVTTPDVATCDAPEPPDWRARTLLSIACELARSDRWSTVLTPGYGRGHHDHFHIDARPDDVRVFVR